jgi:MoaA/NifB/PqqE/SkfB family radical SAM enzyme
MERKITVYDPYEKSPLENEITLCYIDILSSCNLACPSCPVGNMKKVPGSIMELEQFKKIISKLKKDYPHLVEIGLYNWTEPLLHPRLHEFIEVVKEAGFSCTFSSNFNFIKNLENVVKSEPNIIRISLSGFEQKTYEKGHKKGNIETVKQNMKILSEIIKKYQSSTNVTVLYLKYKHNISDIQPMKEYAHSLGFEFEEYWAYLMPVEKNLEYLESPETIDPETNEIIHSLNFEPRSHLQALEPYKKDRCLLLENQLVLNASGEIQLCCASYNTLFPNKNYLDLTSEQIKDLRHKNDLCAKCTGHGINMVYCTTIDESDLALHSDRITKIVG